MNRSMSAFAVTLLCVGACSIINSTEDLRPVEATGGTSNEGGKDSPPAAGMNGGGSDTGGEGTQAGTGAVGVGGCAVDCSEGGAPPVGRDCTVSATECGSSAPICDASAGECRACASNEECQDEVGKDYCVTTGAMAGRCAVCQTNADCSGKTPVCNNLGACRACGSDDECDSGVCQASGACAVPASVVYALAETGISGSSCGEIDTPCRNLSDATVQLTNLRPNLVLIKTVKKFTTGAAFPALKGLRVTGNGVAVHPYDGATGFSVPAGAEVTLDNVVIEGSTAMDQAGIVCTGGAVTITNSTLQDNATAVRATDCDMTIASSRLVHNAAPLEYGNAAVQASCTKASCDKLTAVLRNRFIDNGVAINFSNQAKATIENNLFLRNGSAGYTRVIELRSDVTHFAYNTLVENFNDCTYVGIVACDAGTCNNVANISYGNFPNPPGGMGCPDQVWYGGTLTYSLTEATFPGSTNKSGDPKFVDAANGDFTPGPGSPALDKGDPDDVPPFDIDGHARPLGAGPDIGAFEAR
jgi:hypothetical protein